MPIELPALPYSYTALEPYIDEETLITHHSKHHAKYVATANSLIANTEMDTLSLEELVKKSSGPLFNNAAQVWNHTFYWNSLSPSGGGLPTGKIAALIERDFGGYDNFRTEISNAAVSQFGSGWAWLVYTPTGLKVTKTSNAETPITDPTTIPILTIDVWEHAYYLKYKNLRPDYVTTVIDKLLNWEFANANLPTDA